MDWKLDYLLCRRTVEDGDDAFQEQPVVEQVRLISEDPLELEVTLDGGVDVIILATPEGPSTTNEQRPHGLRVISTRDGQIVREVKIGTPAPEQGPGYLSEPIQDLDYGAREVAIAVEQRFGYTTGAAAGCIGSRTCGARVTCCG